MKLSSLGLALVLALFSATGAFAQKQDPKPTVDFAKSWDAAIAEAKALGVPIVVHSHGFY